MLITPDGVSILQKMSIELVCIEKSIFLTEFGVVMHFMTPTA